MKTQTSAKLLPLGDYLVETGRITDAQKEEALRRHWASGLRVGEVLVEMGAAREDDISRYLAERADLMFVRLRTGLVDRRVAEILPREKAELYGVLPLFKVQGRLTLAISEPNQVYVVDEIRKLTGLQIDPVVTLPDDIVRHFDAAYGGGGISRESEFLPDVEEADLQIVSPIGEHTFEDIAEMAGESPTINLVNTIVLKAIQERASDIHIEPEATFFRVRYRIDGVLYEVMRRRIELHPAIVSRLKIMANLDIAERRMPQDGRIQVMAKGRQVDLRFSSLPGVSGEKIVLRVLDRQMSDMGLSDLGLAPDTLASFHNLIRRPHGMVLVTGPTGSGKTTTLYAGLRSLNSLERNIVTIEDPVEYQFDIINQNQVREEIGLTFARILKHTLRQDPDIVMVGEIRDGETAEIAVQAALTGHLVLTTLHTNDAPSAITRLLEMGVEPYLLASSLSGVIAQRLVRMICTECVTKYYASPAENEALGLPPEEPMQLAKGRGCPACYDSGYRGRVGIYELLTIDRELQSTLIQTPSLDSIRKYQEEKATETLRSEGLKKVREGVTTLEEITRAVYLE